MKTVIGFLVFLAGSVIIFSCATEETTLRKVPEGNVNLSSLTEGQKSIYLKYTTTCDNLQGNFSFTGDTLVLETIQTDEGFNLKESLTPGSPSYSGNSALFRILNENDDVLIPDRSSSSLFYFYGNDTIHLKPVNKISLRQNSCKLMIADQAFTGDEIGYVKNFTIGPVREADKIAISCVPLIFQLDAYLLYDESYLYMSHTVSISNQNTVSGWILHY